MKKIVISIIISLIYLSNIYAFSDVNNSWYKESIMELKSKGVVKGFNDGNFHPNEKITRAEMLKMLFESSEISAPEWDKDICFPDLEKGHWSVKYICYAKVNSIAKGYSDGNFKPNGEVSVLEALALTLNISDFKKEKESEKDDWYTNYINFAEQKKIIPKNAYTINTKARRGQVADIMVRTINIKNNKEINYDSIGCNNINTLKSENLIVVNNKNRSYLLSLPKNYNSNTAYPLVIGLHGRTNSNEMVKDYMGLGGGKWNKRQTQDVISIYPAGLGDGPYTWHEAENIDFIDTMLKQVTENLCINKSKVHSVGHSLGAYFSNKVSCLRGDIISTMTAVAGPGYDDDCSGPVKSLIMHNKADRLVNISDGKRALEIRKKINECKEINENLNINGYNCIKYNSCSNSNPVLFCGEYKTYGDVPHSWPTSGASLIFDFFDYQ